MLGPLFAALLSVSEPAAAPAREDAWLSRQQNILRIEQAILGDGLANVSVSDEEVRRRLSGMSNQELRELAGSLDERASLRSPLMIVAGSVLMLIFVVLIVVAVLE